MSGALPEQRLQRGSPASGLCIAWGALNAAVAVAMAAASAHAENLRSASYLPQAVAMHQYHALALVVLGALMRPVEAPRAYRVSVLLFSAGLLLFCANLYARALWGWELARPLVPVGGACFISAWVALAVGAWPRK